MTYEEMKKAADRVKAILMDAGMDDAEVLDFSPGAAPVIVYSDPNNYELFALTMELA